MARKIRAFTVEIGQEQELDIAQGEDCEYRITFTRGGAPADFTSLVSCKLTVRDPNQALIVARPGAVLGAPAAGVLSFIFGGADTVSQAVQNDRCDVEWSDGTYVEQLLAASIFRVLEAVSQNSDPLTPPPVPVPASTSIPFAGSAPGPIDVALLAIPAGKLVEVEVTVVMLRVSDGAAMTRRFRASLFNSGASVGFIYDPAGTTPPYDEIAVPHYNALAATWDCTLEADSGTSTLRAEVSINSGSIIGAFTIDASLHHVRSPMRARLAQALRLLAMLAAAFAGGALYHRCAPPAPIVVSHGAVGLSGPNTRIIGADWLANASTPCAPGSVCTYRDSDDKLKLHKIDNTIATLGEASLVQSNSIGTYDLTLQTDGRTLEFNPNDTYPHLYMNVGCTPSGDSEPDCVWKICWNCQNGGGLVDPAHWASGMFFERHFVGGHPQTETHITATGTNGIEHRFVSMEGHENDNSTRIGIDATTISMGIGNDLSTTHVVFNADQAAAETIVSAPAQHNQVLLVDGFGSSNTATLIASDGTHSGFVQTGGTGAVELSGDAAGVICITHNGTTGANGCDIYDDGVNNIVASPDGAAQITFANGAGPQIKVSGTFNYFFQAAQFFIFNKQFYVQNDAVGTNTRIDGTNSALFRNTTASTNGAPQQWTAPAVVAGNAWTGSASQSSDWSFASQPVNGSPVVGHFALNYSSDDANVSNKLDLDSNGVLSCSQFKTTTATVATGGGGSTAVFAASSVGGAGQPTTATQSGWLKMIDSTGATVWVPVWK